MKILFWILGLIQWSCFSGNQLNFQTDGKQLDSMTVVTYPMNDLCFSVTTGPTQLTITPSRDDVTYMWQLTEPTSLRQMAEYVGNENLTPTQFWQAYIDVLFFDPTYDLVKGSVTLNYSDLYIEDGNYTLVLAGCDNEGKRTGEFFTQSVRIPERKAHTIDLCSQAMGKETEPFFYLWKNGKAVRHLPCSDWDSIRIEEIEEPVNPYIEGFEFSFEYNEATNVVKIIPTLPEEPYIWCLEDEYRVQQAGGVERMWQLNAPINVKNGFIDTGESYCNLNYEIWMPGTYYLMVAGYKDGQTSPVFSYKIIQK